MIKCTRTERKFKIDFLENKTSNEKFLLYIFDFFFRVESPPFRLYHQLPITLYTDSVKSAYLYLLRRATLYLDQATHRRQDDNQMSVHPYCVPSIVLRTYYKSQEFSS